MSQLSFFSRSETAAMRDRTKSRNYSPSHDEFRREHKRRRDWGLQRRHAEKLRRLHQADSRTTSTTVPPARAAPIPPEPSPVQTPPSASTTASPPSTSGTPVPTAPTTQAEAPLRHGPAEVVSAAKPRVPLTLSLGSAASSSGHRSANRLSPPRPTDGQRSAHGQCSTRTASAESLVTPHSTHNQPARPQPTRDRSAPGPAPGSTDRRCRPRLIEGADYARRRRHLSGRADRTLPVPADGLSGQGDSPLGRRLNWSREPVFT